MTHKYAKKQKKNIPLFLVKKDLLGIGAYAPMLTRTPRTFWAERIKFWDFRLWAILGPGVLWALSTFFSDHTWHTWGLGLGLGLGSAAGSLASTR